MRVLIFGVHCREWSDALSPEASVWRLLPDVTHVRLLSRDERLKEIVTRLTWRDCVVIPVMEKDICAAPSGYRRLHPTAKTVEIFGNKARFIAYARAFGLLQHLPEVYTSPETAVFPCVVKRTDLNFGEGVAVALSKADIQSHMAADIFQNKEVVIQQYVPGLEHTSTLICKAGRIISEHSFTYIIESDNLILSASARFRREPYTPTSEILEVFAKFLAPVRYDGPCNIDYKFSPTGALQIMEINPRLGGSLMQPSHVEHLAETLATVLELAG